MKRALRIIVPLIMAIAVLLCLCWYFLIYDQALTRDLLLYQARYFEKNNNHKAAATLYDIAYYQSSQDDDIAIELAEQYRIAGNYTKAEYTITEAISDNPSAQLYTVLSKLYVEQDKLMDAVNMLDSVSDPAIKAELDARRPKAPVLAPESGFYSQYITVVPESSGGILYLSSDGEYPSITQDAYTEPVTLPLGETVLHALVVSDNGLVSPLTISGYTVGGVIEPVNFADEAIGKAARKALGYDDDDVVFTNDLWTILEFTIPQEAQNYQDLSLFTHLASLTMRNSEGDLSFLSSVPTLKTLDLRNCRVSDEALSAIGTLTGLERLTMAECSLSTVSPLEPLKNLQYLDLSGNTLRNISTLSQMTQLKQLYLGRNALTKLGALSDLLSLEILDISYNSINGLSGILPLTSLKELHAAHNRISSVAGISALTKLTSLDLSHNTVKDVSDISACTQLNFLNLSNNEVEDITALSTLQNILQLNFSYNQVTALPAFSQACTLVSIDGSYNQVVDLEPLAGLSMLNTVLMDYNPDLESLEPLDKCPVLIKVNAYGTKVTEVSFLTAKSIVVNFDPTL